METLAYIAIAIYGTCLLFIFFYSLVQLNLAIQFTRSYRRKLQKPILTDEEWPKVTIQLPVYNELYVIERLIDAVCAFDYPKDRLEIQLLDDSTDAVSYTHLTLPTKA